MRRMVNTSSNGVLVWSTQKVEKGSRSRAIRQTAKGNNSFPVSSPPTAFPTSLHPILPPPLLELTPHEGEEEEEERYAPTKSAAHLSRAQSQDPS